MLITNMKQRAAAAGSHRARLLHRRISFAERASLRAAALARISSHDALAHHDEGDGSAHGPTPTIAEEGQGARAFRCNNVASSRHARLTLLPLILRCLACERPACQEAVAACVREEGRQCMMLCHDFPAFRLTGTPILPACPAPCAAAPAGQFKVTLTLLAGGEPPAEQPAPASAANGAASAADVESMSEEEKKAVLAILNDGSTDRQPQLPLLKLGLLVLMFAGALPALPPPHAVP
jgi:hypothetical protein